MLDALARALRLDQTEHAHLVDLAASGVAALRFESGRHPHDRRLTALIDELRQDPQVDRWWGDHTVHDYASVTKKIHHPVAGDLSFDIEIVSPRHDPDQRLVVYTTEAGSPTAHMLPILASWSQNTPIVR